MQAIVISEIDKRELEYKIKQELQKHSMYDIQLSTCWSDHSKSIVYTVVLITK